jgi:hypothetical protein
MDMGISYAGRADDFHFLIEGIFELAFEEGRHLAKLEVDDGFVKAFRVPEGETDALTVIHFGFEVARGVVGVDVGVNGAGEGVGAGLALFPGWKGERGAEEVDEGGFARVAGADYEDAVTWLGKSWTEFVMKRIAYLKGVGSFLLRTLLGLLMELMALLA